mmetsp:Transcript_54363/g.168651  ORF Transcript_54363/g.168651 Transcript_54363/m.168651 type:complete len:274 (-) Transcript_54363:126-947(-)
MTVSTRARRGSGRADVARLRPVDAAPVRVEEVAAHVWAVADLLQVLAVHLAAVLVTHVLAACLLEPRLPRRRGRLRRNLRLLQGHLCDGVRADCTVELGLRAHDPLGVVRLHLCLVVRGLERNPGCPCGCGLSLGRLLHQPGHRRLRLHGRNGGRIHGLRVVGKQLLRRLVELLCLVCDRRRCQRLHRGLLLREGGRLRGAQRRLLHLGGVRELCLLSRRLLLGRGQRRGGRLVLGLLRGVVGLGQLHGLLLRRSLRHGRILLELRGGQLHLP